MTDLKRATTLLVAATMALTGCAATAGQAAMGSGQPADADYALPDPAGAFDYQLGGAYEPADGVTIVVRDSTAQPAEGVYSICYVNAFQTQPGDSAWWLETHPEAVLTDEAGAPVIDPAWPDEYVLDTRTEQSRAAILDVVAATIDGCADAGFAAVEFDNLDTWTRFDALTREGNLALAGALVEHTHAAGLAAGQKNAAELGADGPALGFDFIISEECAVWDECGAYAEHYGDMHLDIEYTDDLPEGLTFAQVCDLADQPHLTVLRDRQLVTPSSPDHVFELCA